MRKDAISRETAQKLAAGQVTRKKPNWDTYQVQILQRAADQSIHHQTFRDTFAGEQTVIAQQIRAYYAPGPEGIQRLDQMDQTARVQAQRACDAAWEAVGLPAGILGSQERQQHNSLCSTWIPYYMKQARLAGRACVLLLLFIYPRLPNKVQTRDKPSEIPPIIPTAAGKGKSPTAQKPYSLRQFSTTAGKSDKMRARSEGGKI